MRALTSLLKPFYFLLFAMCLLFTGCAAIEGIFKTGFYAGIFVVVLVVGLILYLIMRSRSGRNS